MYSAFIRVVSNEIYLVSVIEYLLKNKNGRLINDVESWELCGWSGFAWYSHMHDLEGHESIMRQVQKGATRMPTSGE